MVSRSPSDETIANGYASKAALAKLRPTRRTRNGEILLGDIILAVDEVPIRNNKDLVLALENYDVGDRVIVTVWRDGAKNKVAVDLEIADWG